MIAIFVTFNIKPANLDQFMQASYGDAAGSVGNEPGCFRFDILKDKEVATRVHFYEVYKDQAAVDAHIKYPHYLNWRAEVEEYFDNEPQITFMQTAEFPMYASTDLWMKQKHHMVNKIKS
tara:strand:- start:1095 stop:1454 length:360 start_codon:yes stop_codon:yes gene_type:complete